MSIEEVKVTMGLSLMKNVTCDWILGAIDHIKRKPEMIVNGFSVTGILDAIHSCDTNSGDPFEDLQLIQNIIGVSTSLYNVSIYSTYSGESFEDLC